MVQVVRVSCVPRGFRAFKARVSSLRGAFGYSVSGLALRVWGLGARVWDLEHHETFLAMGVDVIQVVRVRDRHQFIPHLQNITALVRDS